MRATGSSPLKKKSWVKKLCLRHDVNTLSIRTEKINEKHRPKEYYGVGIATTINYFIIIIIIYETAILISSPRVFETLYGDRDVRYYLLLLLLYYIYYNTFTGRAYQRAHRIPV